MEIKHIANICGGQDGAVWENYLFRLNSEGLCLVYDLNELKGMTEPAELTEVTRFTLDRVEDICPHSNAVMFGKEYIMLLICVMKAVPQGILLLSCQRYQMA